MTVPGTLAGTCPAAPPEALDNRLDISEETSHVRHEIAGHEVAGVATCALILCCGSRDGCSEWSIQAFPLPADGSDGRR